MVFLFQGDKSLILVATCIDIAGGNLNQIGNGSKHKLLSRLKIVN